MRWSVKQHEPNSHSIRFMLPRVGTEQWLLLMSDVHHDSVHCARDLAIKHLDQANDLDAIVLDNGDFFDAMQGKYDRRADTRGLRKELTGDPARAYIDAMIEEASEWLDPYKHLLALRALGNHETAIAKHAGYNLTQGLVDRLRVNGAKNVFLGGYGGYINFDIYLTSTKRTSFDMFYYHGKGRGGEVTQGLIQMQRRATFIDTDIIWTAHVHKRAQSSFPKLRRRPDGSIEEREQCHVQTPGYSNDFLSGLRYGGFAGEKGGPTVKGAVWLRFVRESKDRASFDFRDAK